MLIRLLEGIELEIETLKPGKRSDVESKDVEGRPAIPWSSCEVMELKGEGLHFRACLPCEKGHPAPILWTKFSGVIPSRIGMRKIAVMENRVLALLDIEGPQNHV